MPVNYNGCWGETMQEARAKAEARNKARRAAQQAEVKRRKPKIVGSEDNGEFFTIEFTRDDGERVVGTYQLSGWDSPPAALWEEQMEEEARAAELGIPMTVVRGSKEAGKPPRDLGDKPRTRSPSAPPSGPDREQS